MTTPKAVISTRVSTEEQAEEGTSLQTQEEKSRMQAALYNAQIVAVIVEEGISGARYQSRKGIQEALYLIESKQADMLIVYRLDRLGRTARIILDIAERVDRAGGRLVTCDGQEFGGTPTGKMMLTMLAAMAEFERATIRERSTNGKRARAKQGSQPSRTYSPFGYHIVTKADALAEYAGRTPGEYVLIEEAAQWVRSMYLWCVEGASLRQICRRLQQNGVLSPRGGMNWVPITVKTILENPVYKGCPAYGRTKAQTDEGRLMNGYKRETYQTDQTSEHWISMNAPAIVDEATWTAAVSRMKANKNTLSGNPGRRYLLSGILRCRRCGQSMSGNSRSGRNYYQCCKSRTLRNVTGQVCARKSRRADAVEGLLLDAVKELSQSPEQFGAALRVHARKRQEAMREPEEADRMRRELADLDRQEEAIAKLQVSALTSGRDTAVYDRLLAELDCKRKPLRARLCDVESVRPELLPEDADSEAARIAEVLRRVRVVLDAEDVAVAEKHALLTTLIAEIRPMGDDHEDGYEIELQSGAETVRRVVINLTVSGTFTVTVIDASEGNSKPQLRKAA
jgi:site-specific DNA recombinase